MLWVFIRAALERRFWWITTSYILLNKKQKKKHQIITKKTHLTCFSVFIVNFADINSNFPLSSPSYKGGQSHQGFLIYICVWSVGYYAIQNVSLKRHKNSFHTEMSTKYQCWNCLNTYVRKENVLKHSRQRHNDNDNKYIIVEMKNKKYNPQINRPAKWVPLPEARPKQGTTYRITIPAIKPKMQPKQQGESCKILYLHTNLSSGNSRRIARSGDNMQLEKLTNSSRQRSRMKCFLKI